MRELDIMRQRTAPEAVRRVLKFSGHESFVPRYGWLPKLYEALASDPELFGSDERAILALGLGRNMVKSIRFWGDAFGVSATSGRRTDPTTFGRRLLDPASGIDPYLEDVASLWRLHWNLVARGGLGAWQVVFDELRDAEIPRERLVAEVAALAERGGGGRITANTAAAHADILVRAYAGSRETDAAPEEALGSPLQELDLVRTGEQAGRTVVRIVRGPKPGLDLGAFAYALHDFWTTVAADALSISMRTLLLSPRSPGRAFALDEASLHERLDATCAVRRGLELREDGAGGVDLVAADASALQGLETAAW